MQPTDFRVWSVFVSFGGAEAARRNERGTHSCFQGLVAGRGGSIDEGPTRARSRCAQCGFFFSCLMQEWRNFTRLKPWSPLRSACLEHSIDAALRNDASGFLVTGLVATGGFLADGGVVVCALAAPTHTALASSPISSCRMFMILHLLHVSIV